MGEVHRVIENSVIEDNFDHKDDHPSAADIILLLLLLVKNLAIWVSFFPGNFFSQAI